MKLLVLTSSTGSFNSIRPEAEIYISLAKLGYSITIMTQEDNEYQSRFLQHGIKIINTDYTKKFDLKLIKNIKKTINEENIQIVYATNSKSIANGIIACIGSNTKLITYRGTTGGLYRHDPSAYFNALNPRVDGVICVSQAVKHHVSKQVLFKHTKVVSIYKGHEISWYNQKNIDLHMFSTNSDNFNIAFVANVRPHKGLIYVLQAMSKLANNKKIHLLLIGKKIEQEPYLSAIKNSGMSERIHITGYRNDVPEIISACDILVHASTRKEGLPRVILEALASNTPVIASDNESSLEIIEDGINGCITPIKSVDAIADTILQLYQSPKQLKLLKENSSEIVRTTLSHTATVQNFDQYFTSLLST